MNCPTMTVTYYFYVVLLLYRAYYRETVQSKTIIFDGKCLIFCQVFVAEVQRNWTLTANTMTTMILDISISARVQSLARPIRNFLAQYQHLRIWKIQQCIGHFFFSIWLTTNGTNCNYHCNFIVNYWNHVCTLAQNLKYLVICIMVVYISM